MNHGIRSAALRRLGALAIVATVVAGCHDATAVPTPASLSVVTGNNAVLTVGAGALDTLSVAVFDIDANRLGGISMQWTLVSGSGTLSSAVSLSDANGVASVVYTPGDVAGPVVISAQYAAGIVTNFNITLVDSGGSASLRLPDAE